jgi:S1-C subfamily serine protease
MELYRTIRNLALAAPVALAFVMILQLAPVQAGPDLSRLKASPGKTSLFPTLGERLQSENGEGGWFKTHPVLSPQEIARLAQKSTALLKTRAGLGTGFFVGKGILATNYHMVEGGIADSDSVVMKTAEDFHTNEYRVTKILSADPEHDVAILAVAGADAVTPLLLASHSEPQVGDEIYIYGNPRGYEGTFALGRISAFRMKAQLDAHGAISELKRGDCIQYTVPTSPGSSGSAVLNNRGEVIGIHFSGPDVPTGATGKDAKFELMNFATEVRFIKDLLKKSGH